MAWRERPEHASERRGSLRSWEYVVFQRVAARILAPDRPEDASIPDADAIDVAAFAAAWMARMDRALQRDFRRFLAFVEYAAPLGCGRLPRFTRLAAHAQDLVLESLRRSRFNLVRAGFESIKALALMGYYRDPRTWSIVGYDGPSLGRPAHGWP
jgi:hypothetical protein